MEEVPALAKYVRRYDYVVAKMGVGISLQFRKQ